MKTEYVIFDKVNKEFLRGTVWYARKDHDPWTQDINEARRFKKPQDHKARKMMDEHKKFMHGEGGYEWLRGYLPYDVEFISLPVTVEVKPAKHFKS